MTMKKSKTVMAMAFVFIALGFVGSASAQSSDYGDYALSDTVTDFDTTSEELLLEFSELSDEDVTVEFLHDGDVVDTAEDVNLDGDGLADYNASDTYDVDQLAVYSDTANVSDVDTVTLYYDYAGSGDVEDTSNYNENQEFTGFEYNELGPFEVLEMVIPWIMVVAAISLITDI